MNGDTFAAVGADGSWGLHCPVNHMQKGIVLTVDTLQSLPYLIFRSV